MATTSAPSTEATTDAVTARAWPEVGFTGFFVDHVDGPWGNWDVTPLLSREPHEIWLLIFRSACRSTEGLGWSGDLAARCADGEVARTKALLEQVVAATNEAYRGYLQQALVDDRQATEALIAREGSTAAHPGTIDLVTEGRGLPVDRLLDLLAR